MLDHVFLDVVSVLERALDDSLLQRSRHEDRLLTDLLSGDVVWETSVSLPGDGHPPRVLADLTLDWSTWSQSAWRSWAMGEPLEEPPDVGVEVVLRLQRLARVPSQEVVKEAVDGLERRAPVDVDVFERVGTVVQRELENAAGPTAAAVEVTFEGELRLQDPEDQPRRSSFDSAGGPHPGPRNPHPEGSGASDVPADGLPTPDRLGSVGEEKLLTSRSRDPLSPTLSAGLSTLAAWIASSLVALGDIEADYLPPDGGEG